MVDFYPRQCALLNSYPQREVAPAAPRTQRIEDPMPEWMMGWPFMIGMIVALVLLIGLYLFLKNNRKDED
jgi:uncharacterized membrane protein YdfJ with MMPL/SSD domain